MTVSHAHRHNLRSESPAGAESIALLAQAVVLERPEHLALCTLPLTAPGEADLVVEIAWSGISTGTERLLWSGRMPDFPGMGYPLVPGYESVGTVMMAGIHSGHAIGDLVFVPGARCFGDVRGLFGGAASRVVVSGDRVVSLDPELGESGVLIALAATAFHALARGDALPELIVGHGVLGRLLARIAVALGGNPVVWETNPDRQSGSTGYVVVAPDDDPRADYATICDVSGAQGILDQLIGRLAKGGQIILAGFYEQPLNFTFPPAFMREARIAVAAEWTPDDVVAVQHLLAESKIDFDGLITHRVAAAQAQDAYRTAFSDPHCLKMVLDWSAAS